MRKLVLFDIDGTLLDSGEAGSRALDKSFREMFSIRNGFAGISMAGKTDIQIIREALVLHKISADNVIFPEIISGYLLHLRIEIENDRKHLKTGVSELLERLSDNDGCCSGVLTGNIEEGAKIKLGAFGLNDFFITGAFGSDHEDRNRLLPFAIRRLELNTDISLSYRDCIVIGDTPLDVACAKPYGALAVAVSTGPYSYESLLSTGADLVLTDLSDTERLLSFICQSGNSLPGTSGYDRVI